MIKNIFLDLDDTILDFHKAEHIALEKTLRELGVAPTESTLRRYSAINEAQWKLLELGQATRYEVKVRRFQLLFEELGEKAGAVEAAERYEAYLAQGHYFLDGAEELLEGLAARYRLFLVSNGMAAVQHGRLKSAGISRYFEGIFISEEVGANKPDRAFFDACFARIPGFRREESLIVGDSLTSDILGGINAGLCTVWLRHPGRAPAADIRPDYTITALPELWTVLAALE